LQLGFIARTPRGRICLKDGYKHMGMKPSAKAQRQMSLFDDEN
jgi:Holliday junction resolvasome RuvABC ATP-dependent DNA helicase subunit